MSSADASHDPELPDVDERLVAPESGYEIYDGKLVRAAPAGEARGTRLSKIVTLVEIHTKTELDVAYGMLTRTSETSDIAPDVSVFPRARDPLTGGRQLEQLVFEVVSPESLSHAGRKAAKLIARGVRRVFAIDVEQTRALEWSASLGTWSMLDTSAVIEDPMLAVPLPIEALVRPDEVDDALARALLIKGKPVIEAFLAQRRAEGLARSRAAAVIVILDWRGVAWRGADARRARADPRRARPIDARPLAHASRDVHRHRRAVHRSVIQRPSRDARASQRERPCQS